MRARASSEIVTAKRLLFWLPVWAAVVALTVVSVAAWQVGRVFVVPVGTAQDQAYVRNFHPRLVDNGKPYRWSDVYGYVTFPGAGGGRPFTLTLELDPGRQAPVTVIVNGHTYFFGTLKPGWRTLTLHATETEPAVIASRDTVLEVRAPDYRAEDSPTEAKGVKVGVVRLEQSSSGGLIVPAYAPLGLLALSLVLFYLLVGRSLAGIASLRRAKQWGLVACLAGGVPVLLALASDRVAVSAAAPHIAVTLVSALLLLLFVDWAANAWKWAPSMALARALAVVMATGFALRYGGMALPQSVIIDMPWHMKWMNTLLAGDWRSLYFPGGLSSVPAEWDLNLLIPKSPLFYFMFAPLSLLPFDLETSVKWVICLMDASVALGVFWLARRCGNGARAAVLAAALYTFMPLAFRAFSYGILPTMFAQWLATAAFVMLLALGRGRWRPVQWVGLAVLLALVLVAFPTVALFVSLVLAGVTLAWWLIDLRSPRARPPWRIPAALAAAWLLAMLSYYDLYVTPVLASASALLTASPEGGTTVKWPGGLPQLVEWTANYVVSVLPLALAAVGVLLFFVARRRSRARHAIWLVVIWLAMLPVFFLANYRVDMIGKHLFFTMAPVAVAGGLAIWQIARRSGWGTLLAALALAAIAWEGLTFWAARLISAST